MRFVFGPYCRFVVEKLNNDICFIFCRKLSKLNEKCCAENAFMGRKQIRQLAIDFAEDVRCKNHCVINVQNNTLDRRKPRVGKCIYVQNKKKKQFLSKNTFERVNILSIFKSVKISNGFLHEHKKI